MYVSILFYFFFFKQKTAYEMRISDWSSDVCSSDLYPDRHIPGRVSHGHLRNGSPCPRHFLGRVDSICEARTASRRGSGCPGHRAHGRGGGCGGLSFALCRRCPFPFRSRVPPPTATGTERTSDLSGKSLAVPVT